MLAGEIRFARIVCSATIRDQAETRHENCEEDVAQVGRRWARLRSPTSRLSSTERSVARMVPKVGHDHVHCSSMLAALTKCSLAPRAWAMMARSEPPSSTQSLS